MSDEQNKDQSIISVQVSSKAVHRAVQNILKNEMKIDGDEIRVRIRGDAEALIRKEVDEFLKGSSYSHANLEQRVKLFLDYQLKSELQNMIKQAISSQVREWLQEQGLAVVEAVIREGIVINLAWNKKVPLKVQPPPSSG